MMCTSFTEKCVRILVNTGNYSISGDERFRKRRKIKKKTKKKKRKRRRKKRRRKKKKEKSF